MSIMNGNVSNDYLYQKIQKTVKAIKNHQQKVQQQHQQEYIQKIFRNTQFIQNLTIQNLKNKYQIQLTEVKQQLSYKNQQNYNLKKSLHQLQIQFSSGYKKQFRKLTQNIVQKQSQIQMLNKQLLRKKQKIISLQTDNQSIKSSKQNLQITIIKTHEILKNQIKSLKSQTQQIILDKQIFQTKYKQTNQKLQIVIHLQSQIQNHQKYNQHQINQLKSQNYSILQQNLLLKLQNQKLKQKQYQYDRIYSKTSKYYTNYNNNSQQNISKDQFNHDKTSKDKQNKEYYNNSNKDNFNNNSKEKFNNKNNNANFISQIEMIISDIQNDNLYLNEIQNKIKFLQDKQNQQNTILSQIIQLKHQNRSLINQLHEIKTQINPNYKQQLLLINHPSLYNYFTMKMKQITEFEQKIIKIQTNIQILLQKVQQIAINGIPSYQINQNQILQKQKQIKSKIKKQIQQKTNAQNKQFKIDLQEYYKEKIQYLQTQIERLKQQKTHLQKIVLLQKVSQNIQTSQSLIHVNVSQSQSSKTQINFEVDNAKKSKQKQLINYLQSKSTIIQRQMQILNQRIKKYKNEIKKTIFNNNDKQFKDYKTVKRCYQCFLRVDLDQESQNNGKICNTCRKYFHLNQQCIIQHQNNCKKQKRKPTKRDSKYYEQDSQFNTTNSNYFS